MLNARVNESQAGIKIAGRNTNTLRYVDDNTQMAENDEQLKSLLIRVKEKSEKADLKLNIQQTKIMVSGPITSWQIEEEKSRSSDRFFLHSKFIEDGDFSHKVKIYLLLGRKSMTNMDSILKSRDNTLLTKVCIVRAVVFAVVMCECESWIIKKAECQRTDAFKFGAGEDS